MEEVSVLEVQGRTDAEASRGVCSDDIAPDALGLRRGGEYVAVEERRVPRERVYMVLNRYALKGRQFAQRCVGRRRMLRRIELPRADPDSACQFTWANVMIGVQAEANPRPLGLVAGEESLPMGALLHLHPTDAIDFVGSGDDAAYPDVRSHERVELEADAVSREGVVASIAEDLGDTLLLQLHGSGREDRSRMQVGAVAFASEETLLPKRVLRMKERAERRVAERFLEVPYLQTIPWRDDVGQAGTLGAGRIYLELGLSLEVAEVVHSGGEIRSPELRLLGVVQHGRVAPLTELSAQEAIALRVAETIDVERPVEETKELRIGLLGQEGG